MTRERPRAIFLSLAAAAALSALASCGRGEERGAASVPPAVMPLEHRFTIAVGGQPVRMRVAVFPRERNRGLMEVRSMPEDEGMLFVFEAEQRMSFYMRNTYIPLDIGYFDSAGVLREIHPMYPGLEDSVTSRADNLRYALEMNQGWYERHGVRAGAVIDLAAVQAAVRARGAKVQASPQEPVAGEAARRTGRSPTRPGLATSAATTSGEDSKTADRRIGPRS